MREYHSGKGTDLYHVWKTMRQRCSNPRNVKYPRYGGRGIYVCVPWDTFSVFRYWAETNGYRKGLTIERIDNDGPYSPSNCRLIPAAEQARNRVDTI